LSTFAALLSDAASASFDESWERLVMTCGEPGDEGGGGGGAAGGLAGLCDEHPRASTAASAVALKAAAALSPQTVVTARAQAPTRVFKPYSICHPDTKKISRSRLRDGFPLRALDFSPEAPQRTIAVFQPPADRPRTRGYVNAWSNGRRGSPIAVSEVN
jgi:hypothetical protein